MARSLRRRAGANRHANGWRHSSATKRRCANRRRRSWLGARCAVAVVAAQTARRRGADAFHSAHRLDGADRLPGGAGADGIDPRAGIVRARPPSGDRRRARAAHHRVAVAGAPAGAGDARSARLLARQLQGREDRDARPLSQASLAGRSAHRPGDPAGQAPRQNHSGRGRRPRAGIHNPGAAEYGFRVRPCGPSRNDLVMRIAQDRSIAPPLNRPLTIGKQRGVKAALGTRMRR